MFWGNVLLMNLHGKDGERIRQCITSCREREPFSPAKGAEHSHGENHISRLTLYYYCMLSLK